MTRQHVLLAIASSIIVISGVMIFIPQNSKAPSLSNSNPSVTIGETSFEVIVADTAVEQVKGLGGKASLDSNQGMYFPQDGTQNPTFWMKDMLIPIDIIWIKDSQVVGIETNVPPPAAEQHDGNLPRYQSPVDFPDAVLEIGANRAQEFGIQVNDPVQFRP